MNDMITLESIDFFGHTYIIPLYILFAWRPLITIFTKMPFFKK